MITMRMPTKERGVLGGLTSCCFQPEEVCNAARHEQTGFCTRKDVAYGERRDRRNSGGSAATREARQREKAGKKDERKREREGKEETLQAQIAAAREKPCKKWLRGTCVACRDVVAKYADGNDVVACHRPHLGRDNAGQVLSYAAIPCARRPCPFLPGQCPYAPPHE